MNAARLLTHYERIAEAPNAIARLRRFILDLAVRGKLVSQDAAEVSVSDLLKRIAAEKARLVKIGDAKPGKLLPSVDGDAEFDIPATWVWTRLGVVSAYVQRGKSPKYAASDGSQVVSQKCVQWRGLDLTVAKRITIESLADYESVRFLRDGDLLWNSTGTGTIGRVIRVESPPEKLVCDSHVTVVRCLMIEPEYLRNWLRSDYVYGRIEDRAAGSTNQIELTAQMAINQAVPLPPLAEQRRIVAKVEELMALCDRLEAARTAREATRDRLSAASLARLNEPDPETFRDDARFALDALPALTARPDQIKQLRQTILNLAVRGRLVPQDSKDEPAATLLRRIEMEKARLVKAGEIRKPKILPPISQNDISGVDNILGWSCARLGDVSTQITKGSTPTSYGHSYTSGGINFIKVESIRNGMLLRENITSFVSEETNDFLGRSRLADGDILFSIAGSIGTCAVVTDQVLPANTNQALAIIRGTQTVFLAEFLLRALQSSVARAVLVKARGGAMNNVSLEDIQNLIVPIPPLAEQGRIVARVDELMKLFDRIEAGIEEAISARSRLLSALIFDVLAPTKVIGPEASN